ncbi:hypothetical protein EUBG_05078 [Escherichia coli O104:H4 str. C236-11]|nr:hypothetical protein EUBG_05078 [Escherichia coli O104:H4 str. C236-11]
MEQILPWQNMNRCHRAVLSQGGQWPTALSAGDHAAYSTACSIGYNLSDGCHGKMALYEIRLQCACLPDYPWIAPCPDRTTIIEFPPPARAASTGPVNCSRTINRWLAEAGVHDDPKGTWVDCPPSLRHPALPRTKSSNAIRRCIRPRKAISGTLAMKANIGVDAKRWPDPQPSHHRGQRA